MATGLQTHYPEAGDLSVCIACGNVSVYSGELLKRSPWPEGEPIPAEAELVQRAIRKRLS